MVPTNCKEKDPPALASDAVTVAPVLATALLLAIQTPPGG